MEICVESHVKRGVHQVSSGECTAEGKTFRAYPTRLSPPIDVGKTWDSKTLARGCEFNTSVAGCWFNDAVAAELQMKERSTYCFQEKLFNADSRWMRKGKGASGTGAPKR